MKVAQYFNLASDDYFLQCYGVTYDENTKNYMLVLELAEKDLRQYLQKRFGQLTWKKKLQILSTVMHTLYLMHHVGFIHTDLHPGNILQCYNFFKISDFGLSQKRANSVRQINQTICGVMPYIAPEVYMGKTYTEAADI